MSSGSRGWNIIPNAEDIAFDDPAYTANNVKDALTEGDTRSLETPLYPLPLVWNATVSNGDFYGYSNLLSGDDTPIVIPQNSQFVRYTWSNRNGNADFTLIFRKNIITATPFLSVSYVNTERDVYVLTTPETFNEGDVIYIEHQDDGNNARDVGFVLFFRALPVT